jgi:hypothetical protein
MNWIVKESKAWRLQATHKAPFTVCFKSVYFEQY